LEKKKERKKSLAKGLGYVSFSESTKDYESCMYMIIFGEFLGIIEIFAGV